ncbi:MAG: hypothetical protein ACTSX3_05140 [Candidatus Thorarchaeota archaeon]
MAVLPDTPEIERLREQCEAVKIPTESRLLIVVSSHSTAVFAGAVLARCALRSGHQVHVTFKEPFLRPEEIANTMASHEDYMPIFVGITGVWTNGTPEDVSNAVFVGGLLPDEHTVTIGSSDILVPAASVFAEKHFTLEQPDLVTITAGITDLSGTRPSGVEAAILELAADADIVRAQKEFLLYGANFLPVRDCLQFSIRPYLHGVTGDKESCDELLEEADLPLSLRLTPLTQLGADEKQRVMSSLIPRIDVKTLPAVAGPNFEFLTESETSPMRWASNIQVLAATAWSRGRPGIALGVWMGDRARLLNLLMDDHMRHCTAVASAVQDAFHTLNETPPYADGPVASMPLPVPDAGVLPEVGRILLSEPLTDTQYLILRNGNSICVCWHAASFEHLETTMVALWDRGLSPRSTSLSSLVLESSSDWAAVVEVLKDIPGDEAT